MKIIAINSSHNYKNRHQANKSASTRTALYESKQPNNINNVNYIAYNNISFKGIEHLNLSKLLSSGYELAQKNVNGEIINTGKNIILKDIKDFISLAKSENAWKKNYILLSDIDLKGQEFQGIGNLKRYFSGIFDGNGFIIKNLVIKKDNSNMVGLFRVCDNAEIKNFNVKNAQIHGKSEVGGIVGSAENNTMLSNITYDGAVNGESVVGGIVGYSKNSTVNNCLYSGEVQLVSKNKIKSCEDDFFVEEDNNNNNLSFIGGIVGISENSSVSASGVNAKILGENNVGGIIGLTDWTDIKNCVFNGDVIGVGKTGNLIGFAKYSKIADSYSLTNDKLIGESYKSNTYNCFSQISSINDNIHLNWDKDIWNISDKKLPRLKSQFKKSSPIDVFIEDVNIDIKNKNIPIIDINYIPPKTLPVKLDDLEQPIHYAENDSVLSEIHSCTEPSRLAKLFAYWTDGNRDDFNAEDKKHDEILLALTKNKHFDLNEKWNNNIVIAVARALVGSEEEATFCNPLYVLSSLNKGSVFREALKRDDINPFIKSGPDENCDIFHTLYDHPIPTNMFLLFDSKNPKVQEYVKQKLSQLPSYPSSERFINLLCSNPLKIFKYNETTKEIDIPRALLPELNSLEEINIKGKENYSSLWDIVSSPDIDGSYIDSQGNNILHLISQKEFPAIEQLTCLNTAINKGADLNIKNKVGFTPYMQAIENRKDLLYSKMLDHNIYNRFYTDKEGNDALLISTKYNNTKQSTLIMDELHNKGFSLNTRDNAQSTPLIEAVKNNDYIKINYLLSKGVAVDLCDENGQTALHHAFMNQNVTTIKSLMNNYPCLEVKDKVGLKPKDYWIDCDLNTKFSSLNWNDSILEYNYAGIKDTDSSSFNMTAINSIHKEIIPGKDFNFDDLQTKGPELEKALIKLHYYLCTFADDAKWDKINKNNVLGSLAQTNNPYSKECILKILKNGSVDINKQNEYGETPLILALKSYQIAKTNKEKLSCMQNIKCLLDNNAKIDIADLNDQTALHYAVFSNNILLFNELLGKHPNINYTDTLGRNPIQYISNDPEDPMRIIYNVYAAKRDLNK